MPIPPDFVPWMQARVADWADKYGQPEHRVFPAWGLQFVLGIDDDEAFNQTDTLSQGDAGLDGWYYDHDEGVLHLVQAKWLIDPLTSLADPTELRALINAALLLKDPPGILEGPHKDKLTEAALDMTQALLDEDAISLDYLIAGRVSDAEKLQLAQAVAELGDRFSVTWYDTEALYALKLSDDPIEDLAGVSVTFRLAGTEEYLERSAEELPGVENAAVATLDGRSLGDAAQEYGARLFHGNVRYYLRRTNRVNKKMMETLASPEGRASFWVFNNGLTIVADSFEKEDVDGITVVSAVNPQIVNGAQTTSVLKERRAQIAVGDVAVQARFIAVSDDDPGRDALAKISEFTNSQSPVRPSDLKANDTRHRQIQQNFSMLDPKIFYERRRGEWQSLTAADRAQYGNRRVSKDDVGQRILAFDGRPAESVAKRGEIYGEFETEAFNPQVSAQVYMLAYEIYGQADDLLKASGQDKLVALVPSLDQALGDAADAPTRLEVLRRVRKLTCAHAVALANDVLKKRYGSIGPVRAAELRNRFREEPSDTYAVVWRNVFRSLSQWLANQPDVAGLRSTLQQATALPAQQAILLDYLAEADLNQLLPPIN